MTSDGLASVLAHSIWNLEWYFHMMAIHIPLPGSIQKHMCYQLTEEAEKELDWEKDEEVELRKLKRKKERLLILLNNKDHGSQTTFICRDR